MPLPTSKSGKVNKQEFFDHAVEVNRLASVAVTTGAARVVGSPLHIFNNPAVDPGTSASEGDWWIGDVLA